MRANNYGMTLLVIQLIFDYGLLLIPPVEIKRLIWNDNRILSVEKIYVCLRPCNGTHTVVHRNSVFLNWRLIKKACLSFAQQNEKKHKSTNLSLRTSNDKIACKQKNLQRFHIYHVEFSQWNLLTVGRTRVRVCSRERRGRRRRRRRRRLMHAVLR